MEVRPSQASARPMPVAVHATALWSLRHCGVSARHPCLRASRPAADQPGTARGVALKGVISSSWVGFRKNVGTRTETIPHNAFKSQVDRICSHRGEMGTKLGLSNNIPPAFAMPTQQ